MYNILYKDIPVFDIQLGKPNTGYVKILNEKYLPFDIYVEESDDFDDRVNNIDNFKAWCSERILPLDRMYAKDILNALGYTQSTTISERAKIGIATRCLSLNDCYWLKAEDEDLEWSQVSLFNNSLENSIFEIALTGKSPTLTNTELVVPDVVTDGVAPKAWQRSGNDFYLLKGDVNDSVTRETEASEVLQQLGLNAVRYEKDFFKGAPVSKCLCFTNEEVNLVKAEWFALWCLNHDENTTDYIDKFSKDFDLMNIADYLVGNSDNHARNWGFLYNNSRDIIGLCPLMDYDHAFLSGDMSYCLPMYFLGQKISQLDAAIDALAKYTSLQNKLANLDLQNLKYADFVKRRADRLLSEISVKYDRGMEPLSIFTSKE